MASRGIDDVVEYRLFPAIPGGLEEKAQHHYLQEQLETYLAHLSRYLVDYIWQNQPFQLRLVAETANGPAHLFGSTDFADNVEDEWFIVYLVKLLSEDFPGLVVQINDGDGEFLLIEAAESLPKWLNPETAENRVYFYGGKMHVIPMPKTHEQTRILPTAIPTLFEAVSCVRNHPKITVASNRIHMDIQDRLAEYPARRLAPLHRTHCYIPAALAAVLDASPALVAPMVQAFHQREPADLKACITFHHFRPGTRVLREVKMTRCLYAQLLHQNFAPDKRSGWTLPSPSNPKFKSHDLGMKLAHGAEILCAKCGILSDSDNLEKRSLRDPRWRRFVNSLTVKGYFKGEMEGSILYRQLLEEARSYFYSSVVSIEKEKRSKAQLPGMRIQQVLGGASYDIEIMRQQEANLRPPDGDEWLDISPEELDAMLQKASGRPVRPGDFDPSHMAEGVSAFVQNVSSHEGAEFPKSDDDEVQFDPNSFMQTMQKVFEFEDEDGGESSDMSEYGSEDELGDHSCTPKSSNKTSSRSAGVSTSTSKDSFRSQGGASSRSTSSGKDSLRSPGGASSSSTGSGKGSLRSPGGGSGGSGGSPMRGSHGGKDATSPVGNFLDMKEYMELMDRELAKTHVGESFEKKAPPPRSAPGQGPPKAPPRKKRQGNKAASNPTTPGRSGAGANGDNPPGRGYRTAPPSAQKPAAAPRACPDDDLYDIDDVDDDDFRPVDVDLNAVKNLLESYNSQMGTAGPASNILGSMGVRVPRNDDVM